MYSQTGPSVSLERQHRDPHSLQVYSVFTLLTTDHTCKRFHLCDVKLFIQRLYVLQKTHSHGIGAAAPAVSFLSHDRRAEVFGVSQRKSVQRLEDEAGI